MTVTLRDDIAFILLKSIREQSSQGQGEVQFSRDEFMGRQISEKDLLGHLDYLNQNGYIQADFGGEGYGGVEPLPPVVTIQQARLTDKGNQKLDELIANPPDAIKSGPATSVVNQDTPFLEKVQIWAGLPDIYDARDIAVVIFRTMRDVMPTEASDQTAEELHRPSMPTDNKALQNDIAELWNDTNPLVGFLSRIRSPLDINDELFLRRIRQEAGLPKGVTAEQAIAAVFAATKAELSTDQIHQVGSFLPGRIQKIWHAATAPATFKSSS